MELREAFFCRAGLFPVHFPFRSHPAPGRPGNLAPKTPVASSRFHSAAPRGIR